MRKYRFIVTSSFLFVLWFSVGCIMAGADTLGFWTFDNINYGNTAGQGAGIPDSSNSKLTGVLGTPFSLVDKAPGVTGKATDFDIKLDGKGGLYVDDSAAKLFDFQPPFTIETWVRSSVRQTGDCGIVTYGIPGGRTGGGGWKLGLNAGNLRFTLFAVVDLDSSVALPFDGKWHHVAIAYSDQGSVSYYLDGVEAEVKAETRKVLSPGAKELNIGLQFNGISRFQGEIDRVRVSNTFLAATDLDSDPANIKAVGDNTLAFFDFDEGKTPYAGKGKGTYSAISMQDWALNGNIPRNNMGLPTVQKDTPSGITGDSSLLFSATQDPEPQAYVVDTKGILDFGTGDWTVEAWVNTDLAFPDTNKRGIIFYYGLPGKGYSFSINTDGRLEVTTLGIADIPSSKAIVPAGGWAHVAIAHVQGKSMDYFINGKLMDTVNYTNKVNTTGGGTLYIGSEWNGALRFSGSIDRIRISNSALTANDLDSKATTVGVYEWSLY